MCNTKNVELLRSLGADEVIDYLKEDFTRNGETYDVVLDAVGKHSFSRSRGSLKPGGLFVATDRLLNLVLALWTSRIGDKKVVFAMTSPTKAVTHFRQGARRGTARRTWSTAVRTQETEDEPARRRLRRDGRSKPPGSRTDTAL